ncbi:MAG: hypothetical protein RL689_168 [Planctomycetota bacterium]|jgi:hypothetical protein
MCTRIKRNAAATLVALSLLGTASPAPAAGPEPTRSVTDEAERACNPVIQVAILLDTSGSMEGLIHQARSRVWAVVNDLARARKEGLRPTLQLALYQYGSDELPASEGFLRCVLPFTSDLDAVSERLFALRVDGSAEYCGMALDAAFRQLSWDQTPPSASAKALPLRVLIIAGNEEFTQGPTDYGPVAGRIKERGIFLNTVHCGPDDVGARTGWLSAAHLGGGHYSSMDHVAPLREVATPFDKDLLLLNEELNATYAFTYGAQGRANLARQAAQDQSNLASSASGMMSRVASKASGQYRNEQWDLVDLADSGKDIAAVPVDELPEHLRSLTVAERKAKVEEARSRRAAIRKGIEECDRRRREWLREHDKHTDRAETFDSAIRKAIREQAVRCGFTFEPD